ncbi:MAG: hypothetical protein LBB76_08885 [Azoarcus sp.]|jgi:hypothetical protein|nr:hypothetical protein [Azoarcus sp.]
MNHQIVIDAHGLAVWQDGPSRVLQLATANPDAAGQLKTWLAAHPGQITLIADMADERHVIERLPRASRADQQTLIQRRLARQFPDSPFTCAWPQPPDGEQYAVMLIALTRPALLDPWLGALGDAAFHGAAVFRKLTSVPFLIERWYRRARALPEEGLLLAFGGGGMRQLLFRQRRLGFTRVIPARAATLAENLPIYAHELSQTLDWLAGQRLIGKHPAVRVLAARADFPLLRELITANDVELDFIDLAAQLANPLPANEAPSLLAMAIAEAQGRGALGQYACPPLHHARRIATVRRFLFGVTALLTAGQLAAAGVDLIVMDDLEGDIARSAASQRERHDELGALETRVRQQHPTAAMLEAGLDAIEQRTHAPAVDTMAVLVAVGRLLAEAPHLRLETLSWRLADTDREAPDSNNADVIIEFTAVIDDATDSAAESVTSPARHAETLRVLWQRQHNHPARIQAHADGRLSFAAALVTPGPAEEARP